LIVHLKVAWTIAELGPAALSTTTTID
jgi:hypothetical protein